MANTVVVWDSCGADPISFFVVTGRDISYLNGKYVNHEDNPDFINTHLKKLVYGEDGMLAVEMLAAFPVDEVKAGATVIVCGWLQ
jgi:hypothetical protein